MGLGGCFDWLIFLHFSSLKSVHTSQLKQALTTQRKINDVPLLFSLRLICELEQEVFLIKDIKLISLQHTLVVLEGEQLALNRN